MIFENLQGQEGFFFGMALKLMFKGLWYNVWFANKIRWKQLRPKFF
jgi:hypothetical protein